MSNALLLIDQQNDFCVESGVMTVDGALEDCKRTADFIIKNGKNIQSIYVTLDNHPYYHISHPCYWKTADGSQPSPYTTITYNDYLQNLFQPVDENLKDHVFYYLQNLQAKGRYNLTLWPPHCLEGTFGACIEDEVWKALDYWQREQQFKNIAVIKKSYNANTEHYSVVQAEVPDISDDSTSINYNFINALKEEDHIFIAGEALSHCVANTINDLSTYIPLSNMTLLTDCASTIKGFEKESEDFLQAMCARGMKIAKSTEITL